LSVSIKDKITTNAFRQLLVVQIISAIISLAGTLIDGVIISRFLGPVKMAAYGLANPIVIIMVSFAFVLSAGSQALCGQHMGRGEVDEVNSIMNKVILTGAIVAFVFNAIIFIFSTELAVLLGAKDEVILPCSDYLRTYSFSALGIMMTPILIGFMQMDRDGKRALRSAIIFVICSTALDLVNVLLLKWDMIGMGLTTSVSYMVSFTVLMMHFAKKDRSLNLDLKNASLKGLGTLLKIGLPAATYHLTNFVKVLSTNLIVIAVGGTVGLFTCTVMHSINPLIMGFINGTGMTTLLMCSVIIGEGNRRSLHYTYKYILKLAAFIGLVLATLIFVLSGPLLSGFFCTGDSALYKDNVVDMLKLYCISIPFTMVNTVIINYFQSMKNLVMSNVICILDNTVYLLSAMLLLSKVIGINGIWIAFAVAEVIMIITLYIIVWVKTKNLPTSIHDLMMVPDEFGVDVDRRMNITITSKEEVVEIYDKIVEFCNTRNIDKTKAMAAGHCMEELATLAIDNNTNNKTTYVDIYMTHEEDTLKLRMRDNGTPIDVSILSLKDDTEDKDASLGMKIIYGMAKDVNYSVVLGLNVFTITI